jgi:hypothetical protein
MAVDITINETIDVVDITVNPNIIEVNVTRTSGGGGSQTLAQTLDLGNETGGENILVNNADAIELENSSKLSQGIVDAGTGGNKGIALTCAVGFEWKFEAGEAYLTETNSEYIRLKQYARSLPSVNDDISKGFVNGSFWYLDSGIAYICTDSTNGAAVWEIYHNFIPTLQQVVNEGGQLTDLGIAFDSVVNPNLTAGISIDGLSFIDNDGIDEETTVYASNGIQRNLNANGTLLNFETPTNSDNVVLVPNGSGTLALTSDIPAAGVPYTGATSDVNLGEFGLLTGNIEFDTTPTNIPTAAGSMVWNDTDGTVDLKLKGANVTLQIGQENVIRVVNKTATNINLLEANYQAVRVTGAQGQRLKVDLAQATTDALSAETIGLVTETINNNQEGFITTSGLIRNVNTTGSLQSETWADGDILYLSSTTAGQLTKVKPTAPNHLVIIGYVVSAHATQGSIFVKVDNGYELNELHNVKITTETNGQALTYTSATDIWENKTIIEDAIVNGVTTVAPSQNAVFDALALKLNKNKYIRQNLTTVTGVTGATVICSILIPANTYESGEGFEIIAGLRKSLTAASVAFRIYHDTTLNGISNNISTGQSLSTAANAATTSRLLYINGTTLRNSINSAVNSLSPYDSFPTTTASTSTFNPAVDNYITITANPTVTTEVVGVNFVSIRPL